MTSKVFELYDLSLCVPISKEREFNMRAPLPVLCQVLSLRTEDAVKAHRATEHGGIFKVITAGRQFEIKKATSMLGTKVDVYNQLLSPLIV